MTEMQLLTFLVGMLIGFLLVSGGIAFGYWLSGRR